MKQKPQPECLLMLDAIEDYILLQGYKTRRKLNKERTEVLLTAELMSKAERIEWYEDPYSKRKRKRPMVERPTIAITLSCIGTRRQYRGKFATESNFENKLVIKALTEAVKLSSFTLYYSRKKVTAYPDGPQLYNYTLDRERDYSKSIRRIK